MSFVKERDEAFTKAVMEDDWEAVRKYSKKYWEAVRKYSKKYNVPMPDKERVMKVVVYKAVQYCTKIPEEVKNTAAAKCLELGFSPFIKW